MSMLSNACVANEYAWPTRRKLSYQNSKALHIRGYHRLKKYTENMHLKCETQQTHNKSRIGSIVFPTNDDASLFGNDKLQLERNAPIKLILPFAC